MTEQVQERCNSIKVFRDYWRKSMAKHLRALPNPKLVFAEDDDSGIGDEISRLFDREWEKVKEEVIEKTLNMMEPKDKVPRYLVKRVSKLLDERTGNRLEEKE